MRSGRRRLFPITSALGLLLVLVIVVHLPPIQRRAFDLASQKLFEASGWQLQAEELSLRAWPAKLRAAGVRVERDGGPVATIELVSARWSWLGLLRSTPRIRWLEIEGLTTDLRNLPAVEGREEVFGEAGRHPLQALEIGSLELRMGSASGEGMDILYQADGLRGSASLIDGTARVELESERVILTRQQRALLLGPVLLAASGGTTGFEIEDCSVNGEAIELTASGEIGASSGSRLELELAADLSVAAGWWDPNMASGLAPQGKLRLIGFVSQEPGAEPEYRLEHTGSQLTLADYDIQDLSIHSIDGWPQLTARGPEWGRATVWWNGDSELTTVEAVLDGAPIPAAQIGSLGAIPGPLPERITATGELFLRFGFPVDVDTLSARSDLRLEWPSGVLEARGSGAARGWNVETFALALPGGGIRGSARFEGMGYVEADLEIDSPDPELMVAELWRWWPRADDLDVAGGPLAGSVSLSGDPKDPFIEGIFKWTGPEVAGVQLESVQLALLGTIAELRVEASSVGPGAARLELEASAELRELNVAGLWWLQLPDLNGLIEALPMLPPVDVIGSAAGEGSFTWGIESWDLRGTVAGPELGVNGWIAEQSRLSFEADPEQLQITELEVDGWGGRIEGSLRLPLVETKGAMTASLGWRDIDIGQIPLELLARFAGSCDGILELRGSLARPEGEFEVEWQGEAAGPLGAVTLHGALAGGGLRLVSEELASGAAPIVVQASIPLGSLPRPDWLWPEAPAGAVEARLDGQLMSLGPLLSAVFDEPWPVDLTGEVNGDFRWDPLEPENHLARIELTGARMAYPTGELVADQPLRILLRGSRVDLEPARLSGPQGGVELGGWLDLHERQLSAFCRAVISPEMARVVPYPVRMHGPLRIAADLQGPLASPSGSLTVDHRDGLLSLPDPTLEIADLLLEAEFEDGGLFIKQGSANVNRGRALLVGGWDPETGQGVVLELDKTTFFVEGILSRWSGLIAVEPDPDRVARIVGDLVLDGGVWDQPVDIGGALFGSGAAPEPAADDPLRDLVLDITVRGRGGIRVENNLGRFDVGWESLHVGGTAARPLIEGDIRIAPGGRINLAGSSVTVQRGTIRFTGDPAVDPVLEIVPVESIAAYGSDFDGSHIDMSSMARAGLAQGIGTALGFRSDDIQPAEIAIETDSISSERFMVGRRLNSNLAFFFTTDLANVQDSTTMLQLWNLPMLRGLALQGYQETLDDSSGVNLVQRFRWGGSLATEDRPEVRKIRFEGDWPLGKLQRRRAAKLRKGDPYDPFLLFVTEMRLERELAAEGYQMAEVSAAAEGSARLPVLVFHCEAGERQQVEFEGADPPREIRRQVVALYQPPPLEGVAFRNMRDRLMDHYRSTGHRKVEIEMGRRGAAVVASISTGKSVGYQGPGLGDGLSIDVRRDLEDALGTQSELAAAVDDRERAANVVESVLRVRGFHHARLVDVVLEPLGDDVELVRLEIEPGPREVISRVVLVGEDPLDLLSSDGFDTRRALPLDRIAIDREVSGLRRDYQEGGYLDVRARSITRQLEDGAWVVEVELEPGVQRRLTDLRFTGRRHTSRRHLRKGVVIDLGDTVSPGALDLSAAQIAEFAPIERVDVVTRAVGADGSELEIAVTEKPRWTAEFGGGYNSDTGLEGRVGLRDDNLFGRGFGLNLRGKWNQRDRVLLLYGSLPHLPGKRLSFLTTVGYREGDAQVDPDFLQEEEQTASVEGTWRLRPGSWARAYYRYTRTRIFEKEPDPFSPVVFDFTTDVGTVGLQYVHDRFDNPFDPSRGWGFTADLGWSASQFGSDLESLRTVTGITRALTLGHGSTWVQTLRLGDATALEGTNLDPQLRFFAGGQGSVRGFDRDSLGPTIEGHGGEQVSIGGGALFVLNEEFRLPFFKSFRGAVFADIAQVWESWSDADLELAVGAGVGIRWSTPIGLVWGDVAWPVANRGISSAGAKFYLGIGKPF